MSLSSMHRRLKILILFGALITVDSFASDSNGHFALKGAGVQSCETFINAWSDGNTDLRQYAGWIDGYISGMNQHSAQTYDAAPWQTTETVLKMVRSVCDQLPPDTRFHAALASLLRQLWPARLGEKSEVESVKRKGRTLLLYRAVLDATKAQLNALGYEAGKLGTEFDQTASDALQKFQRDNKLSPSGLPDQETLFALFVPKPK